MPTGHFGHISLVVEILMKLKPKSILDIGIGYGKYGMLAREYLDHAHFKKRSVLIDGIEGFDEYVQEGQRFYYDHIFVGDALALLPSLGDYEMILILDVLEHFTKEEGIQILKICQTKAKHIIIATPHNMGFQDAVFGNEFERHRFQWIKEYLLPFKPIAFFKNPDTLFALLGKESSSVKKEIDYLNFKRRLRANFPLVYSLYKKIKMLLA